MFYLVKYDLKHKTRMNSDWREYFNENQLMEVEADNEEEAKKNLNLYYEYLSNDEVRYYTYDEEIVLKLTKELLAKTKSEGL